MSQVNEFIKRAAARSGFRREFFKEKNLPTSISNIVFFPFYGDTRSTFNLSSVLLRQYKENNKDVYLIMCSWPGYHDLFPYVDEYWTLEDESTAKTLALEANNLYNSSSLATEINRGLLEVSNILSSDDLKAWHNEGFTKKYWQDFKEVKRYLPDVPSSNKLSPSFLAEMERKQGRKIVVYPVTKLAVRHRGQTIYMPVLRSFWDATIEMLLSEGFMPVVYQNWFTYDMSKEFTDRCVYLVPRNVSDVLAAMREVGLVLDVHSGISRLAIAARTPFIAVDERLRFIESGDYEIDDLCCEMPRKYIFSFSTLLMSGGPAEWKDSLLDNILMTLKSFNPTDSGNWGATHESYDSVSYDRVRERKARRCGVTFISSSKHKERNNGQRHTSQSGNQEEIQRSTQEFQGNVPRVQATSKQCGNLSDLQRPPVFRV
jgi:hypothetical protein